MNTDTQNGLRIAGSTTSTNTTPASTAAPRRVNMRPISRSATDRWAAATSATLISRLPLDDAADAIAPDYEQHDDRDRERRDRAVLRDRVVLRELRLDQPDHDPAHERGPDRAQAAYECCGQR